jgi:hypothetical protein
MAAADFDLGRITSCISYSRAASFPGSRSKRFFASCKLGHKRLREPGKEAAIQVGLSFSCLPRPFWVLAFVPSRSRMPLAVSLSQSI